MTQTRLRRAVCLALEPLEARQMLAVHFSIDMNQDRAAISPFIYGVNPPANQPSGFANPGLIRAGGNRWTAYNWETNASNAGNDYIFQNDDYLGGGSTPGGAVAPTLNQAGAANIASLITVPIEGHVAADKGPDGDVRDSGADYLQTRFDQLVARKGAPFSLTPDTTDGVVYADEFVNWVKQNYGYGEADPNKPIFFSLDNEPDIWSDTHAEIHPDQLTYAELLQKSIDFAGAIKDVEPNSTIFGPALAGFTGYVNLQHAPDENDQDFLTYYLQQMRQASDAAGHRLLDVLDVHWYPETQGLDSALAVTGSNSSPDAQATRVQSARSLWDPGFVEHSYINDYLGGPINLLQSLNDRINQNFPGTKLSISEYNYGGGGDVSGAIAQADALGIFGREGVFSAAQWPQVEDESFIQGGFAAFRNYDGHNASFGDTSIKATTDSDAKSSVYASVDSSNPNIMTIVAINKTTRPLSTRIDLGNIGHSITATPYIITRASAAPRAAGRFGIADPSNFAYTLPAQSVVTLRIDLSTGQAVLPSPAGFVSVSDVSVTEGNAGTKTAVFTVTLTPFSSTPLATPVTVKYTTGSVQSVGITDSLSDLFAASRAPAKAGSDFKATSGSLTFLPGQTKKTVTVTILGNRTPEPTERFALNLTKVTHAFLAGNGLGTIVNDDHYPVTAVFAKEDDGGDSYSGYINVTNNSQASVANWTVEFDLTSSRIRQIYSADIISHTGTHYVVGPMFYNAVIDRLGGPDNVEGHVPGFIGIKIDVVGPLDDLPRNVKFNGVLA